MAITCIASPSVLPPTYEQRTNRAQFQADRGGREGSRITKAWVGLLGLLTLIIPLDMLIVDFQLTERK